MKLMDILQGKWLGHPAHPAVVHIPLGLWLGAAVLDVLNACGVENPSLVRLSFSAVLLGLLGTLVVIPTGVADWAGIKKEKPAWKLGFYHMLLNLVATVVWAMDFGLRSQSLKEARPVPTTVVVLSVFGAGLLLVSGYLGSLLAFDHGISVARLSKKDWLEIAKKSGANIPKEE